MTITLLRQYSYSHRDEITAYLDLESSLKAASKETAKWTNNWRKEWHRDWMKDEWISRHCLPVTTKLTHCKNHRHHLYISDLSMGWVPSSILSTLPGRQFPFSLMPAYSISAICHEYQLLDWVIIIINSNGGYGLLAAYSGRPVSLNYIIINKEIDVAFSPKTARTRKIHKKRRRVR